MATYGERVAQLNADFQLQREQGVALREQEAQATRTARERQLRRMVVGTEKHEREWRKIWDLEDQRTMLQHAIQDQEAMLARGQAMLDLSRTSTAALPQPTASSADDPLDTPKTPSTKRGNNSQDLTSPEVELSPFELRRRANMAQNQTILNSISPPQQMAPPKVRRLRKPSIPVERRESLSRVAKTSTPKRIPASSHSARSQKSKQRSITISEVATEDVIVEFPDKSREFYVLRCPKCPRSFDSAKGMYMHLRKSDHFNILAGIKTHSNTVRLCGVKITDATDEWISQREKA